MQEFFLLTASGVILETLKSNISSLLFKTEGPNTWDATRMKKKKIQTRNTLRTKETQACEQEMEQLYTHKYLLGPPT